MADDTSNGIKQSVRQQFEAAAAHYSRSAVHVAGADLDALCDSIDIMPGTRVLDAGCGAGHTALALAARGAEVIAYDLSQAMLAQVAQLAAARGLTNVHRVQGDVERLPFAAASLDAIASRYSAHHWPAPETALHGFYNALRPGGCFVLSDIVAPEDYAADTFLQTLELLRDPSHVRDHAVSGWRRMLEAAGFEVEMRLHFEISLEFEAWLARIATPPTHRSAIRSLFTQAAPEIKQRYHLPVDASSGDFAFVIPGVVLKATRP